MASRTPIGQPLCTLAQCCSSDSIRTPPRISLCEGTQALPPQPGPFVASGPRTAAAGRGPLRAAPGVGSVASGPVPLLTPSTTIDDVWTVDPEAHGDARGRFYETYRRSWFPQGREMVQGNRSDKAAGAVVGLHYHLHQADYWQVPRGEARVVLHDLRVGSPTEGATETLTLSGDNCRGVFIPPGVAHGFATLTELTLTYLVDQYYNPADELGVAWDDPDIAADWGVADPILSERDQHNPRRAALDPAVRPHASLRR